MSGDDSFPDAYMFVFEVFVAAFFAGLVGVACCAYCYRKIERETREACERARSIATPK